MATTEVKILTEDELKKKANREIAKLHGMELQMSELQLALSENPQFVKFMQFQKEFSDKSSEVFKKLEEQMIASGIKSVKGDWGYLTIAERTDIKVIDETKLPKKFFKKQVDSKKLNEAVKLSGKLPEGTEKKITKYLTKKIKTQKEE
jgi:hypothetical protein